MKAKKTVTIVSIITAVGVAAVVIGATIVPQKVVAAEIAAAVDNHEGPGKFLKAAFGLNLTDKQKADIRAIAQKHWGAAEPLVRKLVDGRRAVRESVQAEPLNENLIRQKVAEQSSAAADLAVIAAKARADIMPLLTEDQKKILMSNRKVVDAHVDLFLAKLSQRIKEGK